MRGMVLCVFMLNDFSGCHVHRIRQPEIQNGVENCCQMACLIWANEWARCLRAANMPCIALAKISGCLCRGKQRQPEKANS